MSSERTNTSTAADEGAQQQQKPAVPDARMKPAEATDGSAVDSKAGAGGSGKGQQKQAEGGAGSGSGSGTIQPQDHRSWAQVVAGDAGGADKQQQDSTKPEEEAPMAGDASGADKPEEEEAPVLAHPPPVSVGSPAVVKEAPAPVIPDRVLGDATSKEEGFNTAAPGGGGDIGTTPAKGAGAGASVGNLLQTPAHVANPLIDSFMNPVVVNAMPTPAGAKRKAEEVTTTENEAEPGNATKKAKTD